ncbi:MAG: nucleotidyltransferase domain-containing protein [bacterium]|nr:nucleotidyltransferase domain-containing protein [bacterium]
MSSKVSEIINQIKPYKPEKIILFGSYAWGKPHRDSDVDLLIIKKTDEPFLERQEKVQMLLRTKTPVDAIVFSPEEFERAKRESAFVREIAQEGKTLYG